MDNGTQKGLCVMRKIIVVFFLLNSLCFSACALDRDVQIDLEQTLFSLKESITKLSLENEEIMQVNASLRQKIKTMGEQYQSLQQEENKKKNEYEKIQSKDQQKQMPLQELEVTVLQFDKTLALLEAQAEQQMQFLQEQEKEEERLITTASVLSEQIHQMRLELAQVIPAVSRPEKIDKYQLARELMETEQKLKDAQEEWVLLQELLERDINQLGDFKTENTAIHTKIESMSMDLEELKNTLKTLESFVQQFSGSEQENLKMMMGLENDIQTISQQLLSMQSHLGSTDAIADSSHSKMMKTKELEIKQFKDKHRMLEQDNQSLRLELKQLRQKMVDLDKKRTSLEY